MTGLIIVILIGWTALSLVYFFANLGRKHHVRQSKIAFWAELVLCLPALVLATLTGLVFSWYSRLNRKDLE